MLPALSATFDVRAIDRAFDRLEHEIDEQLEHAFNETADRVVTMVKATHPWQNRTGQLEANTRKIAAVGHALGGNLEAGVIMGTIYATYLEGHPLYGPGIGGGKWQSLNPAWAVIEPSFGRQCQIALDLAIEGAGLT